MEKARFLSAAIVACLMVLGAAEDVDLQVLHRIKAEAFHNSPVMDYVHLLTDLNGSRLSGSPGHHRAAESAAAAMRDNGIDDAGTVAQERPGTEESGIPR